MSAYAETLTVLYSGRYALLGMIKMFDPIELSKKTEEIVCRNDQRAFYRFRGDKFYGGIATADCVGCCLRCVFCWSWNVINKPERVGKFYSPEEVTRNLISIAEKHGFNKLRISGNEPTIGKNHLLKVLEMIPENFLFILETNGILLGYDESYTKYLSKFRNLHVRVSLKGSNEEEFSKLTGSEPEGFELQLKALENLEKFRVSYHPAVIDLVRDSENLNERLKEINPDLTNSLEIEPLIRYPAVIARLRKAGVI
jgi:uncharacterized Fe-S cluster-containing radical SAM superfamily protein